MRFSAVAAALPLVGAAMAVTHTVQVGGNKQLVYTPNQLTGVADGDTIQFQFLDLNHTVTQSTFANPCSNMTDASGAVIGVDSGYQFVDPTAADVPVWQITLNNASAPLWFFCRQGKHCQNGMVFAVNPTAEKTFDMFKTAAAASQSVNGSPAAANGAQGTTPSSSSGAPAAPPASGVSPAVGASNTASVPSAGATAPAGGAGNGAAGLRATGALVSLVGLAAGLLL